MAKTVKVSVTFEMDERTARLFLQSSIERVINTSMEIVGKAQKLDHSGCNLDDWDEWKPVVTGMWSAMHDKVYRVLSDTPDDGRVFTLRKGDL